MKIERANETDFPELTRIWEASVRATHNFVSEEDILYFRLLVPQYFDAVDLFIIRDKDEILGFLGTGNQEIQMLFLRPDARGKGLGRIFTQFALNEHGVTKVEVNGQNVQAVGFYKHMGFEVTGRAEHDYIGKLYPVLLMELRK